jgi:L-alanine-DL-glutamate epimerase-like enolase superfamily enzyme
MLPERDPAARPDRRALKFETAMKITAIETLVCHARMRNWIFVKVITDQPGLFGWGEATLEWHTRSVVGAADDLSHLLLGENPTHVEHLWQMKWRRHAERTPPFNMSFAGGFLTRRSCA